MKERAIVSHFFPGEGPTPGLSVHAFGALLGHVALVMRIKSGRPVSDRELVDEAMGAV